jgi:hypothetical protein
LRCERRDRRTEHIGIFSAVFWYLGNEKGGISKEDHQTEEVGFIDRAHVPFVKRSTKKLWKGAGFDIFGEKLTASRRETTCARIGGILDSGLRQKDMATRQCWVFGDMREEAKRQNVKSVIFGFCCRVMRNVV